ncbi:MAG: hypothetical protein GX389_02965 [Clostridiaceae bacterium]|jgi:c-di-GMP-binding flagellar brake protein YcgR|nr:hypothetical protein [Clostridiaceae bacterium]
MDEFTLSLGDKIEIEIYDSNGERKNPVLVSQYEKTLKDGSMVIMAPIHAGRLYPIHYGDKLGIVFEKNKELYKFNAEAAEKRWVGKVLMLRIIPKSGVTHLQRRNFFRLNIVLDTQYRMFAEREVKEQERGDFKKTISKDISGGGVCLLANEKPILNWYIEGKIDIDAEIRFVGKIVRSVPLENNGRYSYEMGVEFVEIRDADREKVIGFIFKSQRKMLKKGWSTT